MFIIYYVEKKTFVKHLQARVSQLFINFDVTTQKYINQFVSKRVCPEGIPFLIAGHRSYE